MFQYIPKLMQNDTSFETSKDRRAKTVGGRIANCAFWKVFEKTLRRPSGRPSIVYRGARWRPSGSFVRRPSEGLHCWMVAGPRVSKQSSLFEPHTLSTPVRRAGWIAPLPNLSSLSGFARLMAGSRLQCSLQGRLRPPWNPPCFEKHNRPRPERP